MWTPAINQHDIEIPPLLIQPFVENAIWHGLLHKKSAGNLVINVCSKDEGLIVTVEDDGIGREASNRLKQSSNSQHRKSMGMSITKGRLDIINHDQDSAASVRFDDLQDNGGNPSGTKVTLTIPT